MVRPGLRAGVFQQKPTHHLGHTQLSIPDPFVPFPEHQSKFYEALGCGLVRWQSIETMLYLITFALMQTDQTTCSVSFFQIRSANNKLSFVDKLAFHKLNANIYKEIWKPIKKDLSDIIVFRNHLAHFDYAILTDEGMDQLNTQTKFRYLLSPHFLDVDTNAGSTTRSYSVESIFQNAKEMHSVSYKLLYFLLDYAPQIKNLYRGLEPRLQLWLEGFMRAPRPTGFEPPDTQD